MSSSECKAYLGTIARLLSNGLKFRFLKLFGAPTRPEVASLAVTNRCNSRCIMCSIWKRSREEPSIKGLELSFDEIIDLLSRPLFSKLVELDITGGEPHLRDDLADIVIGAAGLKNTVLPRLQSIITTTNSLLPDGVLSNIRKMLDGLKGTGIDLINVNSLDGIGKTHDTIRGTRGAFSLAMRTIDGLLKMKSEYPNFFVGIKTTVLPHNINSLNDILDFALEKDMFHIISPVFFTETRFRNAEKKSELALNPVQLEKLLSFYHRRELEAGYFYSRALDFLATGESRWSCSALYNYIFVDFDGTIYPCELISEPIGNVKKQDAETIWQSHSARAWRRLIGKLDVCRHCIEPGAIRYSAPPEGFSYLSFLRELGSCRFEETFTKEGYTKYFNRR